MAKLLYIGLILFWLVAGANHFIMPQYYIEVIPIYLPYPIELNFLSGALEIAGGLLLIKDSTRKLGAYILLGLLLLFIPAHVYFIQIGSCILDDICIPAWISWIRLFLIHPLIAFSVYWAGFIYPRHDI